MFKCYDIFFLKIDSFYQPNDTQLDNLCKSNKNINKELITKIYKDIKNLNISFWDIKLYRV